ncbi:hypothetical protein LDENG_00032100 [Lucifuga dentata]|nr:hypothetical protein LDENG_00032100 [Lucifuga dentata]
MPPKTKGSSKSPAKAKTPTLIDGVSTEEISKEQLEEYIVRLREELDREREERNYFQLERDKIHTFREITERQLEEAKAELKNEEWEIEEAEARYQAEIKVYKQKMKHLLSEHQNTISELKADYVQSTAQIQKEHAGLESGLCKEMTVLKVDLQEPLNQTLKELIMNNDKALTETRNSFEKQLKEIEANNKKKLELLQKELENMRVTEICETEDRMNEHISNLVKDHENACSDLKIHWNAVLHKDMAYLESLKKEIKEDKVKLKDKEKRLAELLLRNKHLTESVQEVEKDLAKLQKTLRYYETDKALLAKTKALLKVKEKTLNDRKQEHELLQQKLSEIQLERDELYKTFTQNIQKVQQQADLKNVLLEDKLEALTDALTKKEAQLHSVISASNMDQTALFGVTNKLEEMIDSRNITIKDLQHKKAQVCKAYNDLLLTIEVKLRPFGSSVEELGFKPLESNLAGQTLGKGSADASFDPK